MHVTSEITDTPNAAEDDRVRQKIRDHNRQFVESDGRALSVYLRNCEGAVVAGLIGKTFWNWLHIDYLWVEESLRDQQLGKELVALAESEAKNRGCIAAVVDTFEFQAKGFYEKLGYTCFAELDGFAGEHKRFYFRKHLA